MTAYQDIAQWYLYGKYDLDTIGYLLSNEIERVGDTKENIDQALSESKAISPPTSEALRNYILSRHPEWFNLGRKSVFTLSNKQSQILFDDICFNTTYTRFEDLAQLVLVVMRNDPFYLDTSSERSRRTAIDQYTKAYAALINFKFGVLTPNYFGGEGSYVLNLAESERARFVFMDSLNADEKIIYDTQDLIRARDYAEDNGFFPQQLVENTANLIIYVGIAYIGGSVALEIGSAGGAAAAGSATEGGTIAGSTGLLTSEVGTTVLTTEAVAAPTLGVGITAGEVAGGGGLMAGLSEVASGAVKSAATTAVTGVVKDLTKTPVAGQPEQIGSQNGEASSGISNAQKAILTALLAAGSFLLI